MKVYWLSRHDLSPAQITAIRALHGENVEIIKDPVVLVGQHGLVDYIREHRDGFVYAVAGAPHYITAAILGLPFGVFENHPAKRQDGSFGLAAVYHVTPPSRRPSDAGSDELYPPSGFIQVWINPDPTSDTGEALIPMMRA